MVARPPTGGAQFANDNGVSIRNMLIVGIAFQKINIAR